MSNAQKAIVDLRTYTIRRGGMPLFVRLAETHVCPVMLRHVGAPLAYYVTDIGPQDEVTHLWGYDSVADMEARRQARNLDPEWPSYIEASRGLIDTQETRVVRRVPLPSVDHLPLPDPAKALVDFRVATIRRGTMAEFLGLFQTLALPVQLRHVGAPVAMYVSEIGPLNELIQLWAFDSLADLEARRTARDREPAWSEFLTTTESMVLSETTKAVRRVQFGTPPGP